MNLVGAISPPTLQRRQNEIGLLLDHVGSPFLDRLERTLRRLDDQVGGPFAIVHIARSQVGRQITPLTVSTTIAALKPSKPFEWLLCP